MNNENKHSPIIISRLKYKTLLDFGFKKQSTKIFQKKIKNKSKNCYKTNKLIKLIEYTYSYAKLSLNKYSCRYSKQLYSQPALLTILVLKIYLKLTYSQISEYLEFSNRLRSYLSIKNAPDPSTLQKFFKRMPTNMFEKITTLILNNLEIKVKYVALDDTGFSSDNADKYYAKIRNNERKHLHQITHCNRC